MSLINIPLLNGLIFDERNSEGEAALDCSFTTRLGTLASRALHAIRFAANHVPIKLLNHLGLGFVYTLGTNGQLRQDGVLIDDGYSHVDGTLLSALPNSDVNSSYLFVAGGTKMKKLGPAGALTGWGIPAPPAGPLTISSIDSSGTTTIDNFDSAAGTWTHVNCTLANEATIKAEGGGSLKVTITAANLDATITRTLAGAPVDFSTTPIFSFWIRQEATLGLTKMSVEFDLDNSAFAVATLHYDIQQEFVPVFPPSPQEAQAPLAPQETSGSSPGQLQASGVVGDTMLPNTTGIWKQIFINLSAFQKTSGASITAVRAIRFKFAGAAGQVLYFDNCFMVINGQDDAVGARYKYCYLDTITGHHGNLNATPSVPASGKHGVVTLAGDVAPPAGFGVNEIVLFRDTGGDGNYRQVVAKGIASPPGFTDTVAIENLGDNDLNDNAPAPLATQAIEFMGRVWLNDISNPRRIWRSQPGRYESFSFTLQSGFFDVSNADDIVIGFAVIREQLFVVTRQNIIQVVGDDAAPDFTPMIEIGTLTSNSFFVTKEFMVFAHLSGLYTFDASQLRQVPKIGTLFNPQSTDQRALTQANINTCIVGSDGKHIWLNYVDKLSRQRQLCFSIETQRWSEESTMLVAFDEARLEFAQIAASASSVLDLYASGSYGQASFGSQVIELTPIGHLNYVAIEYRSEVALELVTTLDDQVVATAPLAITSALRAWRYVSTGDNFATLPIGQRLQVAINAQSAGLAELYTLQCHYNGLPDTTHFNSEYVNLADEKAVLVELHVKLFAIEDGEVEFLIDADVVRLKTITQAIARNTALAQRYVLKPSIARAARLQIIGNRFSIIHLSFKAISLGNGEIKSVAIPGGL